ncbi:MAG: bi-domain-containing oxidoreductase [Bacteroidota bacterium]|nr:bi-domain-containing oxidoreductase [Bacteroidota bacterium]MDP4233627.1 bi-domain-containing oxidoreductase [Bacteroidota bacterium]MDP4243113.1 bi-domain-containing oxidoreductase [Bacteroidota bacterium]MDP4288555.1 bi-domain-containing oxidoreductase [Bacteroidota bacterium]
MKQLLQSLRSGAITINDVPVPTEPKRAGVIVRVHTSLISAGTEKMKVDLARASLIDKARKRPDDVKKVLAEVKQQGFWKTYQRVMNKLDTPGPLGYSCAGEVIAVSEDVDDLKPGDRVACGGQGASHAEVVGVLRNLCVKLPDNVPFVSACFTTLGAIAMQGLRQANVTFGESVVVIGLGLVGQLACAIAKAAGCVTIGVDLDDHHVEIARKHTAHHAFNRGQAGLAGTIKQLTSGHGADTVIICAATSSNDPITFSAEIARDRARIIMVGVSDIQIPRDAYFVKELEFRLSRSYGPGRYDHNYEEKGIDLPIGYVRWTERRNMQEFVRLLGEGQIDTAAITTHTFPIERAEDAYSIIAGERKERYLGMVLTYPAPITNYELRITNEVAPKAESQFLNHNSSFIIQVGFIGAGNFAQGFLLPTLKENAKLVAVANQSGASAMDAQKKFGFERMTTSADEVIAASDVNTIFIATRHGDHARLAADALRAGKNVFVEKPMAVTMEQLQLVAKAYEDARKSAEVKFMVGFNRRFSSLVGKTKTFFDDLSPKMIFYRVNAGPLPRSHWTQDETEGGGRIIGEGCHFIDTATYLVGDAAPRSVFAKSISTGRADSVDLDTVSITIDYEDGSVASILYLANGDKSLPKEEIQVFSNGRTAIMKNFTELELWDGSGKPKTESGSGKGHAEEVKAFLASFTRSGEGPIPFDSLLATTLVTFAARESLATGEVVRF